VRTTFANTINIQPQEENKILASEDNQVGDIHFCANLQSTLTGTAGLVIYTGESSLTPWRVWSPQLNGYPV
jgi:hypothetical protein